MNETKNGAVPGVYAAISAVQKDLANTGISKDRKNEQQGYKFRGIDDVFNALAPLLAEHGLCILPRCTSREVHERTTQKGSVLFYVVVEVEYTFVSVKDGSKHLCVTYGEAMDSADKATNKAMSAAYKYLALQAFSIPTEGENDADSKTPPEVVPKSAQAASGGVKTGTAGPKAAPEPIVPPGPVIGDEERRHLRSAGKALFGENFIPSLKAIMLEAAGVTDSSSLTPDSFKAVMGHLQKLADKAVSQ